MEQKKERFCSLASCASDTLNISLAVFNYLFNDVISSHEKDVEGENKKFLSRNLSGGAERRKNIRGYHSYRNSFETETARI